MVLRLASILGPASSRGLRSIWASSFSSVLESKGTQKDDLPWPLLLSFSDGQRYYWINLPRFNRLVSGTHGMGGLGKIVRDFADARKSGDVVPNESVSLQQFASSKKQKTSHTFVLLQDQSRGVDACAFHSNSTSRDVACWKKESWSTRIRYRI